MLTKCHDVVGCVPEVHSLDDYMKNPPDATEWVDDQLVEKTGMTLKHGAIQLNLGFYWKSYLISTSQGGKVYTEVPCRTHKQAHRPDVAYLTLKMLEQYGQPEVLPQSFPLIAEIVSRTDLAEDLFIKAQEYLQSGCEEVWLVFPESQLILVMTHSQIVGFSSGEVASTQNVLKGFSVAVNDLFA